MCEDSQRISWAKGLKTMLDNLGYQFLWDLQDPNCVREYIPQIVQTVSDQQRSHDLARLRNTSINYAYAAVKNHSLGEIYLNKVGLQMREKQLLFKIRIQQDSIYFDGQLARFEVGSTCHVCFDGNDDVQHLLLKCTLTEHLRTPRIASLTLAFLTSSNVEQTGKLVEVYNYSLKCLRLKMQQMS